jgi:ADP-heptose:LPS heptosyltransferase
MKLLIIRTSAMGDVALMSPVIRAMRNNYPQVELVIVTRLQFISFFPSDDDKIKFFLPEFKGRHKGITGIIRLWSDLSKIGPFDRVIDLHDVLRTKVLRAFFAPAKIPVSVIDKARKAKRDLISGKAKLTVRHTTERYYDVFEDAGFKLARFEGRPVDSVEELPKWVTDLFLPGIKIIGIAPFAKHALKRWPEEYFTALIKMIQSYANARFFLFAGPEEYSDAVRLASGEINIINLCGKLNLKQELALMRKLDFMIAMDSSNMHMAALTGTKVISLWGATDPLAGFGAWNQPEAYSLRIPAEELTCRPCTVYGKGKCRRGDFACMVWLTPDKIFERLKTMNLI